MDELWILIPLTGTIVLFVILPWMVLHYLTAMKKANALTVDDHRMLEDLWRMSNTLEARMATLERILDRESPEWRQQ